MERRKIFLGEISERGGKNGSGGIFFLYFGLIRRGTRLNCFASKQREGSVNV